MADTDGERLLISLEARFSKYERDMAKAMRSTDKGFGSIEKRAADAGKRMEKSLSDAAGRVGGVLKNFGAGLFTGVAAGGIAGVLDQVSSVARGIAEIGDQAKRAGVSAKSFQELAYVAKANRVEVDALTDGLKELSLRADEVIDTGSGSAAESFRTLGITAQELKEKLQDPSALFSELIEKMGQLDKASQIRIADELFGGTGGEQFVQLIGQGKAGIEATIAEAHRLGLIMDDELIASAAELDRKFQAVTTTVSTGLKRAVVEVAGAMVDLIAKFQGLYAKYQEARNATEAGALVGSMVRPPDGSPSRNELADSQKLNALTEQRAGLLEEIKGKQDEIYTGADLQAPKQALDLAKEQLATLQTQLATVNDQIAAEQKLDEQRRRAAVSQVYIGGRQLDRSQEAQRQRMLMDRASWPKLPASVEETPSKREDPILFGDPVEASSKKVVEAFDGASGAVGRYVAQVVKAESGGDPNAKNPNSTATGAGQFIATTWLNLFRKYYPAEAASMGKAQILSLRKDADISRHLIEAYAQENAAILRKAGLAVNETALHLAHFLGPGGAVSILSAAPGTPVSQLLGADQIRANPTILGGGATAADVIRYGRNRAGAAVGTMSTGSLDPWAGMRGGLDGLTNAEQAHLNQVDALREKYAELGSIGADAIQGIADALADGKIDGQELLQIVLDLGKQLLKLALQPMLNAPATSNGGSFVASLLSGLLGFAGGGEISGAGTGTSDSILARLSNGEFVVNAASTKKHRHLIEAINQDRLPAFAAGGAADGSRPALASLMGGGAPALTINAPVTVNGSSGSKEQNADLARQTARAMEDTIRGLAADELRRALRPGNLLNRR